LPKYFKTIDCRQVGQRSVFWVQLRERFEQNICEARSEISAIDVQMLLSRHVDFLTSRTVSLDSRSRELFTETDWQHELSVAQNSLAASERTQCEFLSHHC